MADGVTPVFDGLAVASAVADGPASSTADGDGRSGVDGIEPPSRGELTSSTATRIPAASNVDAIKS